MVEISTPQIHAVEGCDGVGKTHFIQSITDQYTQQGFKVKVLSTPSKELPAGQAVRALLKQESLYKKVSLDELKEAFVKSIQEVATQLLNLYQDGHYNLFFLDRWWFSYLAYQFLLEGLSPEQIKNLIDEALIDIFLPLGITTHTSVPFEKNVLFPHVTHFDCDTDPVTIQRFLQKRMEMCQKERSTDVHDKNNEFQLRVLNNYKRLFGALTQAPYHLDYEKKPIPILEDN